MSGKDSPQNVIKKFEKRQKTMPVLLGVLAGVLVLVGVIIIVMVLSGSKKPLFAGLFATKTPTVTVTATPTATQPSPTPSVTPTETLTPTPEATNTPSAPYEYIVKEGEDCWTIAYLHDADPLYLQVLNNKDSNCILAPGEKIYIPPPGQKLPTPTRVSEDVPNGTVYEYTIQQGDTLATIADYFRSTVADILFRNPDITDQNAVSAGQVIKVRANIATPVPTTRATSTLSSAVTLTPTPTLTPTQQP